MKSHYDESKLMFGVPNGKEKSKKRMREESYNMLMRFANTGKFFAGLMANAKDEDAFIEACREVYRKYKEKTDTKAVTNIEENNEKDGE